MGRQRSSQRKALEDALSRALATGAQIGAQAEREASIRDVAASLLQDDIGTARRLVAEHGQAALPLIAAAAREAWPARWRSALGPLILRTMQDAPLQTNAGTVRLGFDLSNPRLAQYFDGYMTELSGNVTETTAKQVTKAIQEGLEAGESIPDIAARVETMAPEISASRADLIARNESLRASKGASYIQAQTSGVIRGKRRLTAHDSRVRPEHRIMDGEERALNEPYSNGEIFSGSNSVNCRCVDQWILIERFTGRVA